MEFIKFIIAISIIARVIESIIKHNSKKNVTTNENQKRENFFKANESKNISNTDEDDIDLAKYGGIKGVFTDSMKGLLDEEKGLSDLKDLYNNIKNKNASKDDFIGTEKAKKIKEARDERSLEGLSDKPRSLEKKDYKMNNPKMHHPKMTRESGEMKDYANSLQRLKNERELRDKRIEFINLLKNAEEMKDDFKDNRVSIEDSNYKGNGITKAYLSKKDLRKAIIMKEVLDRPLGLRD